MAKKNILMVVNPISGDVDKSEFIQDVKFFSDDQNLRLILYETKGQNDENAIRTLCDLHQPERVLVAGGDGTIKMAAEALADFDVIIGILPAGSANGLSVDLNLPSSFPELLEIAFNSNAMEMDMISINGKKSMHLSDLGLNAELIKNYQNSSTRGKLGYALQSFVTISEMKEPFFAKIQSNDKVLDVTAQIIIIANSNKYGTGVTINPNGKMDDGKFELVIIKNLDDTRNWVVWHKDLSASNYILLNSTNAQVQDTRTNGGQARPFGPFTSTTFGVNLDNILYIKYFFNE